MCFPGNQQRTCINYAFFKAPSTQRISYASFIFDMNIINLIRETMSNAKLYLKQLGGKLMFGEGIYVFLY